MNKAKVELRVVERLIDALSLGAEILMAMKRLFKQAEVAIDSLMHSGYLPVN